MKETGLTGKRRSTTIAATPDDGNSQRKRRRRNWAHCYPRGVATIRLRAAILVLCSNAPVIAAKTGEHDFTGGEYRSSEAIPA